MYGGFWQSLRSLFDQADIDHVWANAICISGALLVYKAMTVIRKHLGEGGLIAIFRAPMPADSRPSNSA